MFVLMPMYIYIYIRETINKLGEFYLTDHCLQLYLIFKVINIYRFFPILEDTPS